MEGSEELPQEEGVQGAAETPKSQLGKQSQQHCFGQTNESQALSITFGFTSQFKTAEREGAAVGGESLSTQTCLSQKIGARSATTALSTTAITRARGKCGGVSELPGDAEVLQGLGEAGKRAASEDLHPPQHHPSCPCSKRLPPVQSPLWAVIGIPQV